MKDSLNNIHPSFKLNGISYTVEELNEVAYSLVKEGLEHEMQIGDFLMEWLSSSNTIEVHTSGSTGQPKKIILQKTHMRNSAAATGEFLGLKANDTALLCLPMNYIAGKMMMVRALVLGLDLYATIPSSSPLFGISKKFDFCAMVPNQLNNSLDEIERIKNVIVGGAPLALSLKKTIGKKRNLIYETFGMTETISHIAMRKLSCDAAETYFTTLSNITIAADHRNCLSINAPDLGVEELISNDVVNILSTTTFLWLGRLDNVVNSGGIKLHPEIIEEKLNTLISGRFFTAGMPDEMLGEKLVLVVEGECDTKILDVEMRKLNNLEKIAVPKAIYLLPNFVMTANGKINRGETLALISS